MKLTMITTPAAAVLALSLSASPAGAFDDGRGRADAARRSNESHAQSNARAADAPRAVPRVAPRVSGPVAVAPRVEHPSVVAPRVEHPVYAPHYAPHYVPHYAPHYYAPYGYVPHYAAWPWFHPHFTVGFGIFLGYPVAYPYAYPWAYTPPPPAYGYPSVAPPAVQPGAAYGGLTFQISPSDAAVYVDGNYAGTADTFYDPQHPLTLAAGAHRVEVVADGYRTLAFDATVVAGQVMPYQGSLQAF